MANEKSEAEVQGHPEATLHAARVSVLDALRYAAIVGAVVDAAKAGGTVNVPQISTWTPYGKRYIKIVVADKPFEEG